MTAVPALPDSVFMVCGRLPDGGLAHLGTAWVCGRGLALTAWHVVQKNEPIVLLAGNGSCGPARVLDHCVQLDVALLAFRAADLSCPPLPMNDDGEAKVGDRWISYGHPVGFPQGFPMDGTVSSPYLKGSHWMVLNCLQGPKEKARGMSGAPVVDTQGCVIAIVTGYPQDLDEVTLFAARLDDVFARLREWSLRMPDWVSQGGISRYLSEFAINWDRPTHRAPFRNGPTPSLSDIFVTPRFRAPRTPRALAGRTQAPGMAEALTVRNLLDTLVEDQRDVVVRGDPGTGKSVLLRWMATDICHHWCSRRHRQLVPVLVHASALVASGHADVMGTALKGHGFALPAGAAWLLLVDGLDEVIDVEERRKVIERFKPSQGDRRLFRGSPVRLVLASRALAILDEFHPAQAQQYVLKPFSRMQLEAFAAAWFSQRGGAAMATRFMAELDLSRLEGLASVPALATMAAFVFERSRDKTLPRRRSDLYARFIELILVERSPLAWQGFQDLCQRSAPGVAGEQMASRLWEARLRLATELALQI